MGKGRLYMLKNEDEGFTTGAYIRWDSVNKVWTVVSFEDDSFFDGIEIEAIETNPHIFYEDK